MMQSHPTQESLHGATRELLLHFIYLERLMGSGEPDGKGFAPERLFARGTTGTRLTPMGIDYATVGEFYGAIGEGLPISCSDRTNSPRR
jgi:hypothetical protein